MELAAEVELIELIGSELDRVQQGWDAAKGEIDRLQDELANAQRIVETAKAWRRVTARDNFDHFNPSVGPIFKALRAAVDAHAP